MRLRRALLDCHRDTLHSNIGQVKGQSSPLVRRIKISCLSGTVRIAEQPSISLRHVPVVRSVGIAYENVLAIIASTAVKRVHCK